MHARDRIDKASLAIYAFHAANRAWPTHVLLPLSWWEGSAEESSQDKDECFSLQTAPNEWRRFYVRASDTVRYAACDTRPVPNQFAGPPNVPMRSPNEQA